jgi:hypothetical protein
MYNNSPYKTIPTELIQKYTLDGKIPIINCVLDSSKILHHEWSDEFIKSYLEKYTIFNIKNNLEGKSTYGNETCVMLLDTFVKYNIVNKNIAIVGSETPWIEAMLINLNNKVTTIEYNVPKINSEYLEVKDYFEYFENKSNNFDVIISFSSIEHSGLGRYGDPLDSEGDIKTMRSIHRNLKEDGLLIWGAPIGNDCLVWNLHRIYGKIRLPLIFENFKEVEWIGGKKEELFKIPLINQDSFFQPVVVLNKL